MVVIYYNKQLYLHDNFRIKGIKKTTNEINKKSNNNGISHTICLGNS